MNESQSAKRGRKPVHIDLVELEKLSTLHCTDEEMAGWFGVSTRTIESRRKRSFETHGRQVTSFRVGTFAAIALVEGCS